MPLFELNLGRQKSPLVGTYSLEVLRLEARLAVPWFSYAVALAAPVGVRYESAAGKTRLRPIIDVTLLTKAALVLGALLLATRPRREPGRDERAK
jgi:hypothetical protein